MTLYDVQYIKHNVSGLPEDDVVNTLHFSTNEVTTNGTTAAAIAGWVAGAHYDATDGAGAYLETFTGGVISRVNLPTLKVYDAVFPGSPLAVVTQAAMRAAGTGASLPSEVACVLSFRADYGLVVEEAPDDADADAAPERPRSRLRGRIFEGPFTTAAGAGTGVSRPAVALRTCLLDYATRLGNVDSVGALAGLAARWCVHSKEAEAWFPIVNAHVDDAWDTQRRRGEARTLRQSITITQP